MSEQAELNLTPPTFAMRNTVGKGKEQTSKNSDRPASDAAFQEYCDKYYHQLLTIITEKVPREKMQQEKLKEVKARLNFKGCSGRNSRIQEVSQHSVSRTPNVRGEHQRGRRSGRSRSMSGSLERTSVFFRLRCDRSESPMHRQIGKERRDRSVFNRLGARKRMCPHIRKAVTRAPDPKKQNHSLRVKTVEEDIRNQDLRSKSQALKKTTCLNHGCVKKQILSLLGSAILISPKRLGCQLTSTPYRQRKKESSNGKKHDDNWRMCVDFKDLNKACLKDGYSLTKIDWKVESLYGYPFKCFLDAYKGYHEIKMAKEDEEKTSFITSQWIFCYSKMPFGKKNARATYQRLVDKAFQKQIGINLEVYDDLVIKSRMEHEIMRDIEETFKTPREINMKLNPKKCTFGIKEGMFLGYKVNTKGIKVCLDKAKAVLSLPSPKKMHKKSDFRWTAKAEVAFKQMKKLIAELPTLTAPMEKEELIVYLVAAREAISAVLMTEREAKFHSEASEDNPLDMLMEAKEELLELWTLFTDELSCVYGSRAGLILTNPEGAEFTYALRF
nr:reverse transcriptase domain-containing protein [Tanacetum cinerariifolium]